MSSIPRTTERIAKSILLVEDEQVLRESIAQLLTEEGYEVVEAADGQAAHDLALVRSFDLVLTDIHMPRMDGLALLEKLQKIAPQTPVIVLTAFGTVDSAVTAMKAGAADFLLKPVQFDDVLMRISRALEFSTIRAEKRVLTEQLAASSKFHNLIGESPAIVKLFELAKKLSAVKSSVLIVGESGTGKELFARAVHYNGVTKDKPFVAVNCGAIPENLIESELFGHRKGSFTGAVRDRVGYFEAASGGTLFLDEISTLPFAVQSSLLRVLEERVVVPVGDTQPRPVDVRIVAASNQDLRTLCQKGLFREDLLYRLDVVRLQLPPLRQRRQDIPLLAHHFLAKYSTEMNKQINSISNQAMRAILNHDWPGNVRELENVIERAVIFAENGQINESDLPFQAPEPTPETGEALKEALAQFERQHILYSLRRHRFDKAEAAKHLGIGVSTLYRKLDELNIPKDIEERENAAAQA